MSKEAENELKQAMDARMKVLATKTPVKPVFNINTACAVKVAINYTLKNLYENQPSDGFSKELRDAFVVLQNALDNC